MRPHLVIFAAFMAVATPVLSQTAGVSFGGLKQDTSLPVEVKADSLTVDQTDGRATYQGNVVIGQGQMRLSAATVVVEFGKTNRTIARLVASGGVTLSTGTDAAESKDAVYTIDSGQVVMTGDVLLTQGATAISGQSLVIDLKAGTGAIEGGVQTVFTPGAD